MISTLPMLRRVKVNLSATRLLHTLTERYETHLTEVKGCDDPAQRRALSLLQSLSDNLIKHQWSTVRSSDVWWSKMLPAFVASWRAPQGIYLCGPVGTGKTMLMDLFIDECTAKNLGVNVVTENSDSPTTDPSSWNLRRTHFHRFMLDIHLRIHKLKGREPNPLHRVARDIAAATPLICFDEFQVNDVADAAILHRLFQALFAHGVVIVATSNRAPNELYEGGINRFLFLPFLQLLQQRCAVVEMAVAGSPPQQDYRLVNSGGWPTAAGGYFHPLGAASTAAMEALMTSLVSRVEPQAEPRAGPLTGPPSSSLAPAAPTAVLQPASASAPASASVEVQVAHGRILRVARAAGGTATFDFDELFGQAVGAADFLALASAFHTVAVRDVPRLDSSRHNEARRFITFVDILYENQARLVVTCAVPLRSLFRPLEVGVGPDRRVDRDAMVDGRVLRAAARSGTASAADPAATLAGMTLAGGDVGREPLRSGLTEASPTRLDLDRPRQRIVSSRETAVAGTAVALGTTTRTGASEDERDAEFTMARLFEAAPGQGSDGVDPAAEVWVKDQGGSSGRVTTMIGQAEWSATGRLGVSLAEFSAVKDVAFSFHRALSRLVEMQSPPYLEAHRAKHRLLSADAALQRREK